MALADARKSLCFPLSGGSRRRKPISSDMLRPSEWRSRPIRLMNCCEVSVLAPRKRARRFTSLARPTNWVTSKSARKLGERGLELAGDRGTILRAELRDVLRQASGEAAQPVAPGDAR